jgi:hypothetical protein
MLVRHLRETTKEQRVFRGEIVEKVFLCEGTCRVLLVDEQGDLVYCLLQGMHWFEKIKEINLGQKVLMVPSKVTEVPKRHKKFYAPEIKGKNVSDLFFHYNKHDFELGIRQDGSVRKQVEGFFPLDAIYEKLALAETTRGSIIGILLDFYIKPNISTKSVENFYRMRIIDDSVQVNQSIQLNLFLRKVYSLKKVSIGDVIIAQGVNFRKKQSQVVGVHNSSSASLAVISWQDCRIEYCSDGFVLSEQMMGTVCRLQNWIFNVLQYQPFLIQLSQPTPPYFSQDLVLYLVQMHHEFPETDQSTLVFGDPLQLAYMIIQTSLVSHISCLHWVKVSSIKLFHQKIELNENSSLVILPDWTAKVKSYPPVSQLSIRQVLNEFGKVIGKDLYVNINHKHTQMPCMQPDRLLDFENFEEFARVKGLVIDFHPRESGIGVVKARDGYEYVGLMKVYSFSIVLTVYICGKSSKMFYGVNEHDEFNEIVTKVRKVQNNLLKGYGWVELGVKRVRNDQQVYLFLSETEIKNYD